MAEAAALDDVRPGRRGEAALHVALLVLLPALVFAGSLHGGYHLDDLPRIVNNPEIDRVWPPWRHFLDPRTSSVIPMIVQYRPLMPLVLSLNRAAADALGLDRLVALHLGNLALHVASVLLLYLLLGELLARWSGRPALIERSRTIAFAAALLYGVHPVAGVPVNYLVAIDLLLMQLFFLAFFAAHVRLRRIEAPPLAQALPLLLLALSILSKTNAVAAPLLVLCFEASLGGGGLLKLRSWLRALPSGLVVLAFFIFTKLALDFSDLKMLQVERSPLEYPLTQLRLHLTFYLRNAVWPFNMRPLPELQPVESAWEPAVLLGLVLVAGSLALAWRWRRRRPLAAFAIAAHWIMFAPTSSVLPFRLLATDYRQYPSLPWLCLLAVLAAFATLRSARVRTAALAALVTWSAVGSVLMNRTWRDEESLWGQSVRHGGNTVAHMNYAMAVMARDPELAEEHFLESLRLAPGHVRAWINIGLLRMRQGRTEEGLANVRHAAELAPQWALTHHWLARALSLAGDAEGAAVESARAAALDPRNPRFTYRAAFDAQAVGDHEGCLEQLAALHAVEPERELSRFLEAWCLQALGRGQEAEPAYRRFLSGQPEHVQARFNLALLLAASGRCEEAVPELERVLREEPSRAPAHLHLGRCLRSLGREAEAVAELERWRAAAPQPAIDGTSVEPSSRPPAQPPPSPAELYRSAYEAQAAADWSSCLSALSALHRRAEGDTDSRFLEGWCEQSSGHLDRAIAAYRRLLAESPDHLQGRFNLAHALRSSGRCAEAIPELERILELDPARAAAHLHLARCLAESGETARAERELAAWEAAR